MQQEHVIGSRPTWWAPGSPGHFLYWCFLPVLLLTCTRAQGCSFQGQDFAFLLVKFLNFLSALLRSLWTEHNPLMYQSLFLALCPLRTCYLCPVSSRTALMIILNITGSSIEPCGRLFPTGLKPDFMVLITVTKSGFKDSFQSASLSA